MRRLASRVERKRLLSAMTAIAFCLSAMIGFLFASSSDGIDKAVREDLAAANSLALTVHDPIYIDGNAGFAGPNSSTGVTRGSGSESDPYVIEGWEISSFPANGIELRSADVHFVVLDCYVHQAEGRGEKIGSGVYVKSCSNGTIRNCTCSENLYGIVLESSSGNSLTNNFCEFNEYYGMEISGGNSLRGNNCTNNGWTGICLQGGGNSTLDSNSCSSNGGSGVEIGYSPNTSLVNNTCSNNFEGVILTYSDNCSLVGNICSSNNYTGIRLGWSVNDTLRHNENIRNGVFINGYQLDFFNTHSIDTTNTANGKPIYYYKDSTDITVPAGAGEVIMASCTDMRIENQVLSDSDVGIELAYCTRINVTNNTCSWNNEAGIYVCSSDYTSLIGNTCSSNVWTSFSGTIVGSGIYLFYSANNSVIDNLCSGSRNGILLDGPMSDDNIFVNNNFSNNVEYGLSIAPGGGSWTASNRCKVWNNTFYYNNGAGDTYNSSHKQALDCGTNNWWNSTDGYGNYWSDWTQPDASPPFGIVDIPYFIEGWAETFDYYPLTAPHAPINDSISTPSGGLLANPAVLFALAIAGVVVAVAIALLAIRRKKGPDQTIAKAEEPPTTPPGT